MARRTKEIRSFASTSFEHQSLPAAQATAADLVATLPSQSPRLESSVGSANSFAWKNWLLATALVAAVFWFYHPAWHGTYVWDDDEHLLKNPVLQPGGLAKVWKPGGYLNYWPLAYTIYRIEYQFWTLDPLGYHLVNIGLHCLSALLLWRVLTKLRLPGAFLAAAIFALHPVNVESVAWIAQLKGLLSVALALVSVLYYLGFEERGGAWRYVAAIVAFALSALAKGEALTLPIVLLALAWWKRGRITRRDLLLMVPFLLIGACMAGVEIWTQQQLKADVIRTDNILSRSAVAGMVVWFYLWKMVWPLNLIPIYPRWTIDTSSILTFLPTAALIVALGLAWWKRRTWGAAVVMLIVCYGALLAPVLGFVNIYFMRYSFVADHWQYVATIVPCAFFAGIFATIARRYWPRPLAYVAALSLLVVLGMLSYRQSRTYANDAAFYETTLAGNPDCWLAHYNLGEILGHRGQIDAAIEHFRASLALKGDYAKPHVGLGTAMLVLGRIDEAMAEFQKALAIDPEEADADFDLGGILLARGRLDAAIAHLNAGLKHKPYDPMAHNILGLALLHRGDEIDGIFELQRALELRPNFPDAAFNLAPVMFRRGRFESAIANYRIVLASKPDLLGFRHDLASALARRGEFDEAIENYKLVLKSQPDNDSAQKNLVAAEAARAAIAKKLADQRAAIQAHADDTAALNSAAWTLATTPNASIRNGAEAVAFALRAAMLRPNDPAILNTLAAAYAETGKFADAMQNAAKAERLASAAGNHPLAEQIHGAEELYKKGQPYREFRSE